MRRLLALSVLVLAVMLGGCHDMTHSAPVPVAGFVTDMKSFDAFIATHPTPDQFHSTYPDVLLVLPGMPSTREFRNNNSRYFAQLDKDGRITGGKFM
ncbi:hypothetical protein GCM10007862_14700 [Dyella lipolytica]|uniref:Uncharacterized protein n=1 Tax=Dyella lipolytica TaxID=1867835 RepID=A0ABW8ITN7_9GAMM|nr:hypothetical protein [Dyella lipolytica]GLQ46419.1 hypothetical protein GCM10007862_14700 [Dyella lipolytica]